MSPHEPGLREAILNADFLGVAPRSIRLVGVDPARASSTGSASRRPSAPRSPLVRRAGPGRAGGGRRRARPRAPRRSRPTSGGSGRRARERPAEGPRERAPNGAHRHGAGRGLPPLRPPARARARGVRAASATTPPGSRSRPSAPPARSTAWRRGCDAERPPAARVETFAAEPIPFEPVAGFEIVGSAAGAERRVPIPPDLATCADCLRELRDPADRRYRYPFINCTSCGPRFTIALDVPYDRPATTMAGFAMCADCAREYRDPADRRFHAQPIACPACGPRVSLRGGSGAPVRLPGARSRPPRTALRDGQIVAVKGIGGFHLACDATSSAAVSRLRERKRREEKPLAVMVAGLDAARALAGLSPEEEALLASVERPIVLCRRRAGRRARPGGRAGEPARRAAPRLLAAPRAAAGGGGAAARDDERQPHRRADRLRGRRRAGAARRASPISSCSTTAPSRAAATTRWRGSIAGRPIVLRRAARLGPAPIRLAAARGRARSWPPARSSRTRSASCAATRRSSAPTPATSTTSRATMPGRRPSTRLERFLGVRPEVLACDLHPLYLSTRYALQRSAAIGAQLVEVQHHHAHAVSAMAEHGLEGPVLALAWDGTGLGTDGAAWGGELLLAWRDRFERLGDLPTGGARGRRQGDPRSPGASRSPRCSTPSTATRRSIGCRLRRRRSRRSWRSSAG